MPALRAHFFSPSSFMPCLRGLTGHSSKASEAGSATPLSRGAPGRSHARRPEDGTSPWRAEALTEALINYSSGFSAWSALGTAFFFASLLFALPPFELAFPFALAVAPAG